MDEQVERGLESGYKTYSTKVRDSLCQLRPDIVGNTLKVEDHLGELGTMVLLPDFLLSVDILDGLRCLQGSGGTFLGG
jgi:hypothetical protein